MLFLLMRLLHQLFFKNAALTAIITYAFLFTIYPPYFYGMDNLVPALSLGWDNPSAHVMHVSYLLSYPLYYLSQLNFPIEFYTLYVLSLNGLSIFTIAFTLIQNKEKPTIVQYITWPIFIYLVQAFTLRIEFGICSFLALSAGLAALLKASREKNTKILLFGSFVMFAGAILRFDSCVGIIPYIIVLSFYEYFNGNKLFVKWGGGVVLIVIGITVLQKPLAETELWDNPHANIYTVHKSRIAFADYPDFSTPDYQKTKNDSYRLANLSAKEKNVILGQASFIIPQRQDMKWWEKIACIRKDDNRTLSEKFNYLKKAPIKLCSKKLSVFFILVPIALIILLSPQKGNLCRISLALTSISINITLSYLGRYNHGVTCTMMIATVITILASTKNELLFSKGISLRDKCIPILSFIASILALLILISSNNRWRQDEEIKAAVLAELDTVHNRNPEHRYFLFSQLWRWLVCNNNFLLKSDINKYPYVLPLGDWLSCLPCYEQRLNQENIKSDIELPTYTFVRFIFLHRTIRSQSTNDQIRWVQNNLDYYNSNNGTNYQLILETRVLGKFDIMKIENKDSGM